MKVAITFLYDEPRQVPNPDGQGTHREDGPEPLEYVVDTVGDALRGFNTYAAMAAMGTFGPDSIHYREIALYAEMPLAAGLVPVLSRIATIDLTVWRDARKQYDTAQKPEQTHV